MIRRWRLGAIASIPTLMVSTGFLLEGGSAHAAVSERLSRADLATLRAEVFGLVRGPGFEGAEWGVLAVSLESGDTLLSLDPDRPLAPASNQKLFTTAAALHHLGPEHRFATFLLTDGRIDNGILDGNLILYGTGDPAISDQLLESPILPWERFADELLKAGVRAVTGDLIADASFFQGPGHAPSWSSRYLDNAYAAPASALTFAENVVTFHIEGGTPGAPARVRLTPEGAGLRVLNSAVTVPGDSRRFVFLERLDPGGVIEISGRIGSDSREVSRVLPVSDPPSFAGSVLLNTLRTHGIDIRGSLVGVSSSESSPVTSSRVFAPALGNASRSDLRTLAVHYSPPLRELIQILNKKSHNLYAETLLFTIGRASLGDGSYSGGTSALSAYLREVVGLEESEFRVEDGSGLSASNRTTASGLVALLRHVSRNEDADVFWASLPEAGNRRELRRMYQSPAAGNLRAKTGTIRGVSALSGIVHTSEGEPVLFSIVSNNVRSSSRAKRVEDGIGIRLAAFTRGQPTRTAD